MNAPLGTASLGHAGNIDVGRLGRRLLRRAVVWLFYLSVLAIFLISPYRLDAWRIPYDTVGGNFLAKIHPGTWLALFALGIGWLFFSAPRDLARLFLGNIGFSALTAAWLVVTGSTVAFLKVPFSPLIDVFLPPLLYFALFAMGLVRRDRRLGELIHLLMAANAVIALAEHQFSWRLTPYPFEAVDSRSSALFGHPLANASTTGAYVVTLVLTRGRDMPRWLRPGALLLQAMALVTFGGRTAALLALLIVGCWAIWEAVRFAVGRRVSKISLALLFAAAPIALAAIASVLKTDFFDILLNRFVQDSGSSEARILMFRILSEVPLRQVLFGTDPDLLASLMNQENIVGIESFWIAFILLYGAWLAGLFFIALGAFSWNVVRLCRLSSIVPLVFFFVVATSYMSLAAKSCGFGILLVIIMTLTRPNEGADEAACAAPRARRRISREDRHASHQPS